MTSKDAVRDFWNEAACGEGLLLPSLDAPGFVAQSAERYRLEPYIIPFADFESARGLEVLEIGLGLGADHERFALGGARLHGIDMRTREAATTSQRLGIKGLRSDVRVPVAETTRMTDATVDSR